MTDVGEAIERGAVDGTVTAAPVGVLAGPIGGGCPTQPPINHAVKSSTIVVFMAPPSFILGC
jgi:hypothetical protein